jgi:hypothetical protein
LVSTIATRLGVLAGAALELDGGVLWQPVTAAIASDVRAVAIESRLGRGDAIPVFLVLVFMAFIKKVLQGGLRTPSINCRGGVPADRS